MGAMRTVARWGGGWGVCVWAVVGVDAQRRGAQRAKQCRRPGDRDPLSRLLIYALQMIIGDEPPPSPLVGSLLCEMTNLFLSLVLLHNLPISLADFLPAALPLKLSL